MSIQKTAIDLTIRAIKALSAALLRLREAEYAHLEQGYLNAAKASRKLRDAAKAHEELRDRVNALFDKQAGKIAAAQYSADEKYVQEFESARIATLELHSKTLRYENL